MNAVRGRNLTRNLFPIAALLVSGMWAGVYLAQNTGGAADAAQPVRPVAAPDVDTNAPPEAAPACDPDLAMAHVRTLSERIGPRPAGSPEERQAAQYIGGYLLGLGYEIINKGEVALSGEHGSTRNVIARRPSGDGAALLIGAHYDSIAREEPCPGGNDNASGVAAMLELARVCAEMDAPCPLYFVAFGGEEMIDADADRHHYGSRHFYTHQPEPLVAMISVDMIGVGEKLLLRYVEPAPEPLLQRLEQTAAKAGIAVSRKPDLGSSDHEPFAQGGMPAVWIHRLEDPANHSAQDTADRVEPVYIQSVVGLLTEFMRGLAREDLDEMAAWSTG